MAPPTSPCLHKQAELERAQRAAEPERAPRAAVIAWFKSLTPSQRVQVRAFCANCNTKNGVVSKLQPSSWLRG